MIQQKISKVVKEVIFWKRENLYREMGLEEWMEKFDWEKYEAQVRKSRQAAQEAGEELNRHFSSCSRRGELQRAHISTDP